MSINEGDEPVPFHNTSISSDHDLRPFSGGVSGETEGNPLVGALTLAQQDEPISNEQLLNRFSVLTSALGDIQQGLKDERQI